MQNSPIVDLGYAKYRGRRTSNNCTVYLGVPYAEPPVGDRRFRKPVPVNAAAITDSKTHEASQYPDFAVQGASCEPHSKLIDCARGPLTARSALTEPAGAGSEDCLKVDLYVPNNATSSSKYPVLVYIHVSSFEVQASHDPDSVNSL